MLLMSGLDHLQLSATRTANRTPAYMMTVSMTVTMSAIENLVPWMCAVGVWHSQ
jgi:hypothetical protein